ncbi:hypothetical protein SEA_AKHILA_63 [Mycobacterium phage Akhila]|uniref:Uncharacterized protein n=3 Tax=Cheoctovirus TaxID=1623281 RepID=G1D1G2_9CAUD|nr:hypothetical protein PBI_OVECHKIN_73 [Mycobacterium phage Ovechkin]YP_009636481.1 hypothetical protein FGG21_gp068 [Mycobacterium phage DLane]ARM70664.1 hypothetical protein SEA_KINGSLEY_74 [Mycobacterium phage Kingsley]QUE26249.1 hypothetical protein SEA_AKHILA_63 [Mycobacterium phage Akhila]UAJ16664.1 hypothetical protein SEA_MILANABONITA_62 [Mycobacterium phage MilanaBonita]WRQ08571.1 hypothetical protein JDBV01_00455 [Mycobacterium phage mcgavigan]AEK08612.1 hypothetical protein PBI_DL
MYSVVMSSAQFNVSTKVLAGYLKPGETVEMESTRTNRRTGKVIGNPSRGSGVFVGDYRSDDGQMYFMFRDGEVNGHRQSLFGYPVANFSAYTLSTYGPFKFNAQHIHEGN